MITPQRASRLWATSLLALALAASGCSIGELLRGAKLEAINDRGQIVGWAETPSGEKHAAFLEDGRIADTQIASAEDVPIYGLSDDGQVLVGTWQVGGSRQVYLACVLWNLPAKTPHHGSDTVRLRCSAS